jgi:antitoxin component YwqK of YwqJK toxin-antitoxin module
MLGYKVAKSGNVRVIITLEIPKDALTNIDRPYVLVKNTASYKTNKVKVISIEDNEGNKYNTAEPLFFTRNKIIYTCGEIIEELEYESDKLEITGRGIHFFLEKDMAKLYGNDKEKNGLYRKWYSNGHLEKEGMYKDGEKYGLWKFWDSEGKLYKEYVYE